MIPLGQAQIVLLGDEGLVESIGAELVLAGVAVGHLVKAGYPQRREDLPGLMAGADVVVAADRGVLPILHHWVNAVGLRLAIPVLHVALSNTAPRVGPLVQPTEGACYLCWRMRALACADDFETAMRLEESLVARRPPPAAAEPPESELSSMVLQAATKDVLALLAGTSSPRSTFAVITFDGGTEELHPLLARPDCPACSGHRCRDVQNLDSMPDLDIDLIVRLTVDPLCGLIRGLGLPSEDLSGPGLPRIAHAELANARFGTAEDDSFVWGVGKAWTRRGSRDGAVGEALERYAGITWQPERRTSSTFAALDGRALHPNDLVLFDDAQYDGLPYQRWQPDSELEWVPARSLLTDEEVWIPLLAAHLDYSPPLRGALFRSSSNGFAAGSTFADAAVRALLEVIERDAFMIAWSHRLPGRRVAAAEVPDDRVRGLASACQERGVDLVVHLLPTDTMATVVLAIAWSDREPAVALGLGAAMDPIAAVRSAVLEVWQVRSGLLESLALPEVRARLDELVTAPDQVSTLDDHALLYAAPEVAATGLRFLRQADPEPWPDLAGPVVAKGNELGMLVRSLAEVAPDVLAIDVTPADVAALGMRVVRGLVPGFVPIWFGADEPRLGGSRLLEMPSRIGVRTRPARLDELNLEPHPLA